MHRFSLHQFIVLPLIAALSACSGGDDDKAPDDTAQPTDEVCDNDTDDDGDGDSDCDDSDCDTDPACALVEAESNCTDTLDDDSDGAIDCDDTDCADDAACAEPAKESVCDDTLDDDGDGLTDCDDDDCAADPACVEPAVESICDDATDNDGDGATDCDDDDCAGDPACTTPVTEVVCDDGLDDDGDRLFDCEDDDCAADPACAEPTPEAACDDGLDDDGDGLTDCDDADCAADAACAPPPSELDCADGLDEDLDGATDCDDTDCAGTADCAAPGEVVCDDTLDDDGDGLTDCDDADCAADAACAAPPPEAVCDDALDDDADGLTDCDDSDCAGDAACAAATCGETDLGSSLGNGLATGTNAGMGDDYAVSCTSSTAEDVSFTWTAPADGRYAVSTDGADYDTALTLWSDVCDAELDCDDDGGDGVASLIEFDAVAGEAFVFVVDAYSTRSGNYVLNVNYASEIDCRDGTDEDGDGAADCDDDDCSTDATCVPEAACDDGVDEDLDGLMDCDDSDCAAELACTHPCVDRDLGSAIGEVASASTAGEADDEAPTCDTSGATAADVSLLWTAPADATYTFSTAGSAFNTVLGLEPGDCSGAELACNDDGTSDTTSEVTLALTAGEEIAIVIDGAAGESGDFLLDIWADAEVVCDDGGDDEGDGLVDCLDDECAGDAACDASVAHTDLGSTTGAVVASGTTAGGVDDSEPSCTSSYAEDVSFAWLAPTAGDWTFDLTGSSFDTALYLVSPTGEELECNDDYSGTASRITTTLAAGELVIIVVDGYSSYTGSYTLGIY